PTQHIICERKGSHVTAVFIHFRTNCTADEAYETAKRIMTGCKCPKDSFDDLEVWHTAIVGRVPYSTFIQMHEKERNALLLRYPNAEIGQFGAPLSITLIDGRPDEGNCRFVMSTMIGG